MPTNLKIDDNLINKAVLLGNHKTKKDAVTHALQQYIQFIEQEKIIDLFGKIEYNDDYDYKEQRNRS